MEFARYVCSVAIAHGIDCTENAAAAAIFVVLPGWILIFSLIALGCILFNRDDDVEENNSSDDIRITIVVRGKS